MLEQVRHAKNVYYEPMQAPGPLFAILQQPAGKRWSYLLQVLAYPN